MHEFTAINDRQRVAIRAIIVVLVAFAVFATTALSPANATSGGENNVESVRSTVLDTYDYKIGLLTNLKAGTDNSDRRAIYEQGIGRLNDLKGAVAAEENIDKLWALKDKAHAVYHETVNAADQVGRTPTEELAKAQKKANDTIAYKIGLLKKWVEGCTNPDAQRIVAGGIAKLEALYPLVAGAETPDDAYKQKDKAYSIYHSTIDAAENAKGDSKDDPVVDKEEPKEEPKEKTAAEKAAEALAKARATTLSLIDHKTALLGSAASAANIPAIVDIYETATDNVEGLRDAAKAAKSIEALNDINDQVMNYYNDASSAADEVRTDDEEKAPESTLSIYLHRVTSYINYVTATAAETEDDSPETYKALEKAQKKVQKAVESLRTALEKDKNVSDRWGDVNSALHDFRRAIVYHYIALGRPLVLDGVNIPG